LSQDPDKWITELEELRMRIITAKSKLTEESFMENVLNHVPAMYSIEVSKLEDRLGDLSNPLTIKEICAALYLNYECGIQRRTRISVSIRMKKLPCLLEASRANATIAVDMDTSQEIAAIGRTITTTTTTGTTRTTKGMETRTVTRSLSRTSAIIARKKDIWQRTASRRSAMKSRRGKRKRSARQGR
jgi:hypothetical protein